MAGEGIPEKAVDISAVVPVYESARTLDELYQRLSVVLDSMTDSWELVLVNDGSSDESWERLKALSRCDRRVVSINLLRNFGQHNALMCGLRTSTGRYVVTMDDDLQHPPEEIPKLVKELEEKGADAVLGGYGSRKHSPFRKAGSLLVRQGSFYLLGIPRTLQMTSFRIIRRTIVEEIVRNRSPRPRVGLILLSVTRNVTGVRTEHHARIDGRSRYSLPRLVGDFMDNILNYSPRLPRRFGYAGLVAVLLALALTTLLEAALLTLVFSGLALMACGIAGEYRRRIVHASDRPQYVVGECLNVSR
jgi:glycosyltransferase involved in cell wall biosynthesis